MTTTVDNDEIINMLKLIKTKNDLNSIQFAELKRIDLNFDLHIQKLIYTYI